MKRRPFTAAVRGQAGITLIEVILATFIAGFLVVVMGVGYLASVRAWGQGQEKLILQQEATFALEQVARDVRASRWVALISATELRCFDEDSTETVRYELGAVDGTDYLLRSGVPVVPEECESVEFDYEATDGVVLMEIQVIDDQENRVRVDSKAHLRNRNISEI